jgi:hypothetical protein
VLAARAKAPLARSVWFTSFGRSRLVEWSAVSQVSIERVNATAEIEDDLIPIDVGQGDGVDIR